MQSTRRSLIRLVAAFAAAGAGGAVAGVFDPDVYGTGATMADYMRQVPGGGQPGGPAYDFRMGQYEITNAQFAAFLNDAQLDGGATGRGSNMHFDADGRVRIADGGFTIFNRFAQLPISYDPSAPLGQRYGTQFVNGADVSMHPVHSVSWFGAIKFANWLTIDHGLGEGERAYAEGPNADDWHPVTISSQAWLDRDLNAGERAALVNDVKGFRLPMDDQANGASAYNEFYKAAAWDTDAGVNRIYGFGRDTIDNFDANGSVLNEFGAFFRDDPFEEGILPETTPVGFYDGTQWQQSDWNWPDDDFATFDTNPNENSYGIFDLSGNILEWGQDQRFDGSSDRPLRGGSWAGGATDARADFRNRSIHALTDSAIGFRLVFVPEPGTLTLLALLGVVALKHEHS
jgi:formylglycine-generating enzyme required for sulfatase activity